MVDNSAMSNTDKMEEDTNKLDNVIGDETEAIVTNNDIQNESSVTSEISNNGKTDHESNDSKSLMIHNKEEKNYLLFKKYITNSQFYLFLVLPLIIVAVGIMFYPVLCQNCRPKSDGNVTIRKYFVHNPKHFNISSLLKHVHIVLRRFGWQMTMSNLDWDLLWTYTYPFGHLKEEMAQLKKHQRVNHFPGCGFFTNKATLSTMNKSYIPKSFKLPTQKEEFLRYAHSKPEMLFVQKKTTHREVSIVPVSEIDLENQDIFIQEYINKPFLVDGHKFDIGIYVIITSFSPLRAYYYKGDVLFRYCPEKYHPFDPKNLNKYVVEGVYRPTWKIPALQMFHAGLGFGMRDTFEAYLRSKDIDPGIIWTQAEFIIGDLLLSVSKNIVKYVNSYKHPGAFFELVRFDLILDEDMKMYLMESNMSPNLQSTDYHQNRLLYEQVLYNLFTITGLGPQINPTPYDEDGPTDKMISSMKNLVTWPNICYSKACIYNQDSNVCSLCKSNLELNQDLLNHIHMAYREHINRADTKRLYPPPMKPVADPKSLNISHLTIEDTFMYLWFQGKCNLDATFCS